MNILKYSRDKYFLASSGLLVTSFCLPWSSLQVISSGVFLYNFLERADVIEITLHPEINQRKLRLAE